MQKRFYIYIFSLTLLFANCQIKKEQIIFENASYYIFALPQESMPKLINVAAQTAKDFKKEHMVDGEIAVYEQGVNYQSILKKMNARIVCQSYVANIKNIYAYSPQLSQKIYLQGNAINIHIAIKQNKTVIMASPIIFSGY